MVHYLLWTQRYCNSLLNNHLWRRHGSVGDLSHQWLPDSILAGIYPDLLFPVVVAFRWVLEIQYQIEWMIHWRDRRQNRLSLKQQAFLADGKWTWKNKHVDYNVFVTAEFIGIGGFWGNVSLSTTVVKTKNCKNDQLIEELAGRRVAKQENSDLRKHL